MHELGITRNLVGIVSERCEGRPVLRVRLEIGWLTAVVPDAVRFCFDVCAADTPLAGAELEIVETPASWACNACGRTITENAWSVRCECGATDLVCRTGRELRVVEMELG